MIDIKERLRGLDFLRGISAIVIACFFHYEYFGVNNANLPLYPLFHNFYDFGSACVELFFLISGVVFTLTMREKIRSRQLAGFHYFVNRFSRLYPLFAFSTLCVAGWQFGRILLGIGQFHFRDNNIRKLLLTLMGLDGVGIGGEFSFNATAWVVGVFAVLYFLFYFMSKYIKDDISFFGVSWIMVLLGLTLYRLNLSYPWFNTKVSRGLISFFVGCVVAMVLKFLCEHASRKALNWLQALAGAIVLLMTFFCQKYGCQILGDGGYFTYPLIFVYFPACIFLICVNKPLNRFCSARPFRWLSDISYTIYMMHYPILLILSTLKTMGKFPFDAHTYRFLLLYVLVVLIVSLLANRTFEKPMYNLCRLSYQAYLSKQKADNRLNILKAVICTGVTAGLSILLFINPSILLNNTAQVAQGTTTPPLTQQTVVEQTIKLEAAEITSIQLQTITWKNAYRPESSMHVQLLNEQDGVLMEHDVLLNRLPDSELYSIPTGRMKHQPGAQYRLRITADADESDFALLLVPWGQDGRTHASVNGVLLEQDLCMMVNGS